jgi:hypothetical protein
VSDVRSLHDAHDLEFVARAAAGDLAAGEEITAHERLAACETCAALAADLRAIAAATRKLGPAATRAASTAAPRDFRLTEADAARLRRRGFPGAGGGLAWTARQARGFGGALATLGLVGLLVAAGLPALVGGAASAPTSEDLGSGRNEDAASPIAAMGPQATDAHEFAASGDPSRMNDASGDQTTSPLMPTAGLAGASVVLLVAGLALLVAGRARHRTGP